MEGGISHREGPIFLQDQREEARMAEVWVSLREPGRRLRCPL